MAIFTNINQQLATLSVVMSSIDLETGMHALYVHLFLYLAACDAYVLFAVTSSPTLTPAMGGMNQNGTTILVVIVLAILVLVFIIVVACAAPVIVFYGNKRGLYNMQNLVAIITNFY